MAKKNEEVKEVKENKAEPFSKNAIEAMKNDYASYKTVGDVMVPSDEPELVKRFNKPEKQDEKKAE